MDRYVNCIAVTSQCFVNRIIYYFVHKMMKTDFTRGADIHRRAFANGIAAFKNSD
jgi:hypothetical protein